MTKVDWNRIIKDKLDEVRAKESVLSHIRPPLIKLKAKRKDGITYLRYKCLCCGNEWNAQKKNHEINGTVACPQCKTQNASFIDKPVNIKFNLWSFSEESGGMAKPASRYYVYVDGAEINGIQGVVLGKYEISGLGKLKGEKLYELSADLREHAFLTDERKYLFNDNDSRTTMKLRNVFEYRTATLLTPQTSTWIEKYNEKWDSWYERYDSLLESNKGLFPEKSINAIKAQRLMEGIEFPDHIIPQKSDGYLPFVELEEDVLHHVSTMKCRCIECEEEFVTQQKAYIREIICPKCSKEYTAGQIIKVNSSGQTITVARLTMLSDGRILVRVSDRKYEFASLTKCVVSEEETIRLIMESGGDTPLIHILMFDEQHKLWKKEKNQNKLYNKNIKSVMCDDKTSEKLKYSGLNEYLEKSGAYSCRGNIELTKLLHYLFIQQRFPVAEKIVKLDLYAVLQSAIEEWTASQKSNIVDFTKQSVAEALGLSSGLLRYLLEQKSPSCDRLSAIRELYRLDKDVRREDIEWLNQESIRSESVVRVAEYIGISVARVCEYLEHVRINQCFDPKSAINDWYDYLVAAKSIEADLSDNKVRYPSSLKREHDRAVFKQKLVLDKMKEENFITETTKYGERYGFQNDEYALTVPKDMKDLFEEGRKLNHCVGSYADRIVAGTTCVLFIRKNESPDKPFFTIEVSPKDNSVIQLRGLSNRLIDRKKDARLYSFLKAWSKARKVNIARV